MKHSDYGSHCNGERAAPDTVPSPHCPLQVPPDPWILLQVLVASGKQSPFLLPTPEALGIQGTKFPARPPFKAAFQSTSPPGISGQLRKPGTLWDISSPPLRLPELSPLDCCLSSHSSRHCQSLLPQLVRAPQLQNPVRTTPALVAALAPPAGQASLLGARVPSPFPASG